MREREEESMISASSHIEKHHQPKEESSRWLSNTITLIFYLTCIAMTIIISLELILNDKNIKLTNDVRSFKQTNASSKGTESCNIFRGRWLPDPNASLYTEFSCKQLAWTKNCFLHGRKDRDFLDWKWKPDDCELPRFSAVTFLSILRGKKLAFIGDSLARNQVESLICLLSTVETPESKDADPNNPYRTWEFPEHNFILTVFWSSFLVAADGIAGTEGFHIHLDVVDTMWSEQLPSIDFAVISSSHWFFRQPNYFYHNGNLIGCKGCNNPNIINLEPGRAVRMAFRTALRAINGCKSCKKIVSFVRSYTPGHFENGSWSDGGTCNRTRPVEREEVNPALPDWGYSKMQVVETEMARREGMGKGNEFDFLDVTEMMAMRVDGHPGRFWEHGAGGGSDCLHWCLPGPIDTWNELLLDRIKRLDSI